MLEAGIDRIISQVVDPKINHTFRPQVEKVVQDFLATLHNKEDASANHEQTEEKFESSVSNTGTFIFHSFTGKVHLYINTRFLPF